MKPGDLVSVARDCIGRNGSYSKGDIGIILCPIDHGRYHGDFEVVINGKIGYFTLHMIELVSEGNPDSSGECTVDRT